MGVVPFSLVAGLVSADILSEDDTMITTDDETMSRHRRVENDIMNAVQNCLKKSSKPEEILMKFNLAVYSVKSQNYDNNGMHVKPGVTCEI